MTEQEAIELLQNLNVKLTDMSGHKTNGIEKIFGWNEITAICEAINALEEIKKYRSIGTPEECREAVEKMKPKKTAIEAITVHICPVCGFGGIYDYCGNCGQRVQMLSD